MYSQYTRQAAYSTVYIKMNNIYNKTVKYENDVQKNPTDCPQSKNHLTVVPQQQVD